MLISQEVLGLRISHRASGCRVELQACVHVLIAVVSLIGLFERVLGPDWNNQCGVGVLPLVTGAEESEPVLLHFYTNSLTIIPRRGLSRATVNE